MQRLQVIRNKVAGRFEDFRRAFPGTDEEFEAALISTKARVIGTAAVAANYLGVKLLGAGALLSMTAEVLRNKQASYATFTNTVNGSETNGDGLAP